MANKLVFKDSQNMILHDIKYQKQNVQKMNTLYKIC